MDDLPKNMTNAVASASTFGMGKRHVPMPPEQGRRCDPQTPLRVLRQSGYRRPDFGRLIADETEKWGKVVRAGGLKPE